MTDAWEMHQAETGLNPGPVWRDRGIIINTLTERNQALEERVAELEGSCQRLRDDYQGALAEVARLRAGEDRTPKDPAAWPTPGQAWAILLDSGAEERVTLLTRMVVDAQRAYDCFLLDHDGRIARLERSGDTP